MAELRFTEFRAYCTIFSRRTLTSAIVPVVKIDCTYAKNQIPNAALLVAGGYEFERFLSRHCAGRVQDLSGIHYVVPGLNTVLIATVTLNGTTLISGPVVNLTKTETGGSLQYEVYVNHWLDWLNYSAPHSAYSAPSNPVCLTGHPANFALPAGGLPLGGHLFSAMTHLFGGGGDLWEDRVKPFLLTVLNTNFLADIGLPTLPPIPDVSDALRRIYSSGLPLGLIGAAIPELPNVIASLLLDLPKNPEEIWGTTLWRRLVEAFCPYFMLDIIPCVNSAFIVPSTPTCPYPALVISRSNQIASVGARTLQKPIMLYGIYGQVQSIYGLGPGDLSATPILAAINTGVVGTVTLRRAPPILDYILTLAPPVTYTGKILSIDDLRGAPPISANKGVDPMLLANYVAGSMMMRELLETREAIVVCAPTPAVLVASPGSIISFSGPQFGTYSWYGCVDSVKISVDSENCQAQIAYSLTHCRNSLDNDLCPAYSPLYGTYFNGTSIIN